MGRFDRTILRALIVLAIAQIIGWGTVGLLAIVGQQIAADLGLGIATIFAGTSLLYVTMALWAPVLARAFIRFGARRVMIAGSALAAPGFVLLAVSHGATTYFAAWALLGTAGSATLTTAAFIALNDLGSATGTRSTVGALILMTGLSSSLFWPITAFLDSAVGWRGVCWIFAAFMLFGCVPLYAFGLPESRKPASAAPVSPAAPQAILRDGIFPRVAGAIALNAFVTYGFSAIFIDLLKSVGLGAPQAIACGALLGVLQVATRGLDLLVAGRWDGLRTGTLAGCMLPIAMGVLAIGGGSWPSIGAFLLLYGLASGALAVARATMPLVFYDKATYAQAISHIALPLNLASAASPPLLAGLLSRFGFEAVLATGMICSGLAALILLRLHHQRRHRMAVPSP